MTVLVLGAGGFLGLNTIDALLAAGVRPRCGRRARGNVLGLRQRKVPLVEADLDRPPTLVEAMRGCATVVHLAGHYPRLSLEPEASVAQAARQIRAVLDACAAAGVERLIYVSSTATVAPRAHGLSDERDVFPTAPGLGTYHALKWAMEAPVSAERRFATTTLCPGACLGPFDWKAGTSAMLWQLRSGVCPPHPDGTVSWVDVRDVGVAIAALVRRGEGPSRLLLSAQSVGFQALMEALAARYGVAPVPALAPAEAIALADFEERAAASTGGRPRVSRELVDMILHGARLDATRAPALLGFAYRPLSEALDAFDAWAHRFSNPTPRSEERAS